MRILKWLALAVLIALGTSGCENETAEDPGSFYPAPEVAFTELVSGEEMSLAGLNGKVVLVDIWATWCPPCRMALPHLKDLYQEFNPAGFEIVGISLENRGMSADGLKEFIKDNGLKYKFAYDPQGRLAMRFGNIEGIPTAFLIGKDGKIRRKMVGLVPAAELKAAVKAALSAK